MNVDFDMEDVTFEMEDVTIEELGELSGGSCAGTATTISTPVSTAACVGCASFVSPGTEDAIDL